MPRYRSRSHSYSPRRRSETPPRGRKRYYDDVEEDRYRDSRSSRGRRSPAPSGLLIRNLPLDARPEDLWVPFEKFGQVKDIYLPKNYYTGEPRGFGFVKFRYPEDAAEAKQRMDHKLIGGREIKIVFAEENRKTPREMRKTPRTSGRHGGSSRDRSPPRSPRHHRRPYTPSPSPARRGSRDDKVKDDYTSPRGSISPPGRRSYSPRQRSPSPGENGSPRNEREHKSGRSRGPRSISGSLARQRSPSPGENGSPRNEREHKSGRSRGPRSISGSLARQRSPSPGENGSPHVEREYKSGRSRGSRSISGSPARSRSQSLGSR